MKYLSTIVKEMGKGLFIIGAIIGGSLSYLLVDAFSTETQKIAEQAVKNYLPPSTVIECPPALTLNAGSVCHVDLCQISQKETNCLLTIEKSKEVSL